MFHIMKYERKIRSDFQIGQKRKIGLWIRKKLHRTRGNSSAGADIRAEDFAEIRRMPDNPCIPYMRSVLEQLLADRGWTYRDFCPVILDWKFCERRTDMDIGENATEKIPGKMAGSMELPDADMARAEIETGNTAVSERETGVRAGNTNAGRKENAMGAITLNADMREAEVRNERTNEKLWKIDEDIELYNEAKIERYQDAIWEAQKNDHLEEQLQELLLQLIPGLNHLCICTGRPAHFADFTERMCEENGLLVQLFDPEDFSFPGRSVAFDFIPKGRLPGGHLRGDIIYLPIYKKQWQIAENLDITVPIGYNTVIVKGAVKQTKLSYPDKFEREFYSS